MNRFKNAWMALIGRTLPPEREIVRVPIPVIGETGKVSLYRVMVPDEGGGMVSDNNARAWFLKHNPMFYASCAAAFQAHPGKSAEEVTAIKVGGEYFVGDLKCVHVEARPKRPKGKRPQ